MTISILRPLTVLVIASMLVAPALAEDKTGPNRSEQGAAQRGAVGAHALAHELYAYGQQAKDALAVLTAASLIANAPASETKREKSAKEPSKEGDIEGASPLVTPDLATMLATARDLAGKNETLLAMIEDLAAAGTKGPVGGPGYNDDVVQGGGVDTYTVDYKGGELAELAIKGNGATAILVRLVDENGSEICVGDDRNNPSVMLYCKWQPRWTGPFRIQIANPGRVPVAYRMYTR